MDIYNIFNSSKNDFMQINLLEKGRNSLTAFITCDKAIIDPHKSGFSSL